MTIYEILQEQQKKFKFSKKGILYLNEFEVKEEPKKSKVNKKPFMLYKLEEGRAINKKAKNEMNKARVHGNSQFATYELGKDGVLEFVPASEVARRVKEEAEAKKKAEMEALIKGEEAV